MKILFVMTAASQLTLKNGTQHPTGYWAEEFVAPYERFKQAGYEVEIATPHAQAPPVDRLSLDPAMVGGEENARHLREALSLAPELTRPRALDCVQAQDYDAIFIPGGHGPMEDLAHSPEVARLLTQAHTAGLLTAAVCHGPAALLAVRSEQGWLYEGYQMTAFSNQEENMTPLAGKVPFDLETELTLSGARFSQASTPWAPHVVEHRELLTGENPASSGLIADRLVARLQA